MYCLLNLSLLGRPGSDSEGQRGHMPGGGEGELFKLNLNETFIQSQ